MSDHVISHDYQIRVRYADTDKMGIVYNGNYLRYFEIGRTEMLRSMGLPYSSLELDGYQLPLLEAHIEYLKPARYDDVITIRSSYQAAASPVIRIEYVVMLHGDTLARGYTRHTFVDAQTFKPVRPPKAFTNAVKQAQPAS